MRIPRFEVRDQRSIRLAVCEKVPALMIIAGPNGSGKSTLLNAVRSSAGWTNIIYIGPHRAMRRQQVQQRHLISTRLLLEELLTRPDTPGFEGIQLLGGQRDPWGYDDSSNYLKHTLCQIEVDYQAAIAQRYKEHGEILKGAVPDPWQPLRDLAHNLLPHLTFSQVDSTDRNTIKCLWAVHDSSTLVDLDELSSGEKSIIQMFYPLVERQIRALLAQASGQADPGPRPEFCVLIDEPELHLHPNLQVKVLDYLRVLTTGTQTQVIVATHSPTIVESAGFEELFLLRPVELVDTGVNQLLQVATNDERLRALRDLFGTTSNLTSLQPLVVVEGTREDEAKRVVADRKLYRALHPGFDHVTLLAGGGKSECKAVVRLLNEALRNFSPRLAAVALLDRNHENALPDAVIHLLPVAMIENFLLDPDAIWEAIQSVVEHTGLSSVDDVGGSIDAILDSLEEEEAERRVASSLGKALFRPERPVSDIPAKAAAYASDVTTRYSDAAVTAALTAAKQVINDLRTQFTRREHFHGKAAVELFFKTYIAKTGMSKVVFTFEAARYARRRRSVNVFFDRFFGELRKGAVGVA